MPVSRTAKCTRCIPGPAGAASTWTITSPRSVNFTAFESRLRSTCRSRTPSPRIPAGTLSSTRQPSSTTFSVARGATMLERFLDAFAEIERLLLQLEHAGLDLREVEDVVDHTEERVSARADDLGELLLLRRQLGAEQQAGHPDHGVHRRPDLVAHRREEGALRPCRRLRLLARPLELVEVARLVDRGRGEGGKGPCGPRVLGGVEVGLEAVEREHPDQPVADQQRNSHPALDHPFAEGILELREPRGDVRNDQRLVLLDQLAGRIARPRQLVAEADHLLEVRVAVAADDLQLVAVDPLDAGALVGHHLAQLRQDQTRRPRACPACCRANAPPRGASRPAHARRARSRAGAHSRSRSPPGPRTPSRAPRAPRCRNRARTCRR